ncbi:MAG: hypothetical protein NT084_10760, partial [Bacteroidetes bacterium]|nr:hypothetical protein [Bacteroidota bacterium]
FFFVSMVFKFSDFGNTLLFLAKFSPHYADDLHGLPIYKDREEILDRVFTIINDSQKISTSPLAKFKRDIAFEQKILKKLI